MYNRAIAETIKTTWLGIAFLSAAMPPFAHYLEGNIPHAPAPPGFRPDSIMVFTGSADRVVTGYDLHLANIDSRLMISGKDYAVDFGRPDVAALAQEVDTDSVTIDLMAKNTIENARNGADWAMDTGVKNILLITSENHMPRAFFELRRLLPSDMRVYTKSVPRSYDDDGFDSEFNRLACRVYESFYKFSFCYEMRETVRKFGFF